MNNVTIDTALAINLIATQFPEWQQLPIKPVATSGWDHRTFHLGEHMLIRLPSKAAYAPQVIKEHRWLPYLTTYLPVSIPSPIAMGKPTQAYPWHWSIYRWLPGETLLSTPSTDKASFALDIAHFLKSLHVINTSEGPAPNSDNFHRGGSLEIYNTQMLEALNILISSIDTAKAFTTWQKALTSSWQHPPVWIHGDLAAGNILIQNGRLSSIIDWGQVAVGDPACDLALAWTFFDCKTRLLFRNTLNLDSDTWMRGRAWSLWKACIIAAGICGATEKETNACRSVIKEILDDSNA